MEKIYTTQDINALINFNDPTGRGSGAKRLIPRCEKAGLKIESVNLKGNKNGYKIIENNIDLKNEQWVSCYLKEDWEVSNLGRIRKKNGKQPLGAINSSGYMTICTELEDGKKTQLLVHRLIYFSFYPEQIKFEKNIIIDHINGKRSDNRLSNLRSADYKSNIKYRDENQSDTHTLTTELIFKYGYKNTQQILKELLTFSSFDDIMNTLKDKEIKK